jgi:predicted transcriptional regulator
MTTQIDIPDDVHKQVKQYAANHGTTLKAFVNEAIVDLLKRKQAKTGNPLRLRKGDSV